MTGSARLAPQRFALTEGASAFHAIRYRVPWPYGYQTKSTDPVHAIFWEIFTLGLFDLLLMPIVIADVESTTVHFAFVYDASHVLVRPRRRGVCCSMCGQTTALAVRAVSRSAERVGHCAWS